MTDHRPETDQRQRHDATHLRPFAVHHCEHCYPADGIQAARDRIAAIRLEQGDAAPARDADGTSYGFPTGSLAAKQAQQADAAASRVDAAADALVAEIDDATNRLAETAPQDHAHSPNAKGSDREDPCPHIDYEDTLDGGRCLDCGEETTDEDDEDPAPDPRIDSRTGRPVDAILRDIATRILGVDIATRKRDADAVDLAEALEAAYDAGLRSSS